MKQISNMKKVIYPILSVLILASCTSKTSTSTENTNFEEGEESIYIAYNNPPAEGFDQEGSDMLATLIADKTMLAMGGREAWDDTRFITWNFFGSRKHIWDKWTGDVRIEEPKKNITYLMNINTKQGKVQRNGVEVTDSLDHYLDRGNELWINDSYWLVMPFKLKDTGVTLRYLREDTTLLGAKSDVLSLSFKDVGVTPKNAYNVWVDTNTKFITQWSFYKDSSVTIPNFITPWADYQQYGKIKLSGDRGKNKLTDIAVFQEVPEGTFTQF
jgi:hypothetical protein